MRNPRRFGSCGEASSVPSSSSSTVSVRTFSPTRSVDREIPTSASSKTAAPLATRRACCARTWSGTSPPPSPLSARAPFEARLDEQGLEGARLDVQPLGLEREIAVLQLDRALGVDAEHSLLEDRLDGRRARHRAVALSPAASVARTSSRILSGCEPLRVDPDDHLVGTHVERGHDLSVGARVLGARDPGVPRHHEDLASLTVLERCETCLPVGPPRTRCPRAAPGPSPRARRRRHGRGTGAPSARVKGRRRGAGAAVGGPSAIGRHPGARPGRTTLTAGGGSADAGPARGPAVGGGERRAAGRRRPPAARVRGAPGPSGGHGADARRRQRAAAGSSARASSGHGAQEERRDRDAPQRQADRSQHAGQPSSQTVQDTREARDQAPAAPEQPAPRPAGLFDPKCRCTKEIERCEHHRQGQGESRAEDSGGHRSVTDQPQPRDAHPTAPMAAAAAPIREQEGGPDGGGGSEAPAAHGPEQEEVRRWTPAPRPAPGPGSRGGRSARTPGRW